MVRQRKVEDTPAARREKHLEQLRTKSLMVNVDEAAAIIGYRRRAFHYLKASDPTFPESVSPHGRPMWRRADLVAWVENLPTTPREPVEARVHRIEPKPVRKRQAAGAGAQ